MTLPHSLLFLRQFRFPTINKCRFPLVSATFTLLSESMKPTCLVLTQDNTMISFSAPWKASTVDTWTALIWEVSASTAASKLQICRQIKSSAMLPFYLHTRYFPPSFSRMAYRVSLPFSIFIPTMTLPGRLGWLAEDHPVGFKIMSSHISD